MDVTPKRPADYPKRILVALVGLAPAVVTETVYALASQDPAFIPTQVAVITTGMGKKLILRQLLADPENSHSNQFEVSELTQFNQFCLIPTISSSWVSKIPYCPTIALSKSRFTFLIVTLSLESERNWCSCLEQREIEREDGCQEEKKLFKTEG